MFEIEFLSRLQVGTKRIPDPSCYFIACHTRKMDRYIALSLSVFLLSIIHRLSSPSFRYVCRRIDNLRTWFLWCCPVACVLTTRKKRKMRNRLSFKEIFFPSLNRNSLITWILLSIVSPSSTCIQCIDGIRKQV